MSMWLKLYRTLYRGRNGYGEARQAAIYPSYVTVEGRPTKGIIALNLYSKKMGKNAPVVIEASATEAAMMAVTMLRASGYADCGQFPELNEPLKELYHFLLKKVEEEK